MPQNATDLKVKLSVKQEKAATLVADDLLTDEEIAAQIGVHRKTLHRWKVTEAFRERVEECVKRAREAFLKKTIASKEKRIDALIDRQQRMERVIQARAKEHADVPGGEEGLYVRQVKFVKVYIAEKVEDAAEATEELEPQPHGGALRRRRKGEILEAMKQCVEVEEYAVDTALLREMRETEKQVAIEIGDWTEKKDVTSGGHPVKGYVGFDPEDV